MGDFCCERMGDAVNYKCREHSNPFECPDNLIYFSTKSKEYGLIIHDGGESLISISFCPWCGSRLLKSEQIERPNA